MRAFVVVVVVVVLFSLTSIQSWRHRRNSTETVLEKFVNLLLSNSVVFGNPNHIWRDFEVFAKQSTFFISSAVWFGVVIILMCLSGRIFLHDQRPTLK